MWHWIMGNTSNSRRPTSDKFSPGQPTAWTWTSFWGLLHHRKHPHQLCHTAVEDIYKKRCVRRVHYIWKDSYHPAHRLFALLPSGRHFRCIRTTATWFSKKKIPISCFLAELNDNPLNPSNNPPTETSTAMRPNIQLLLYSILSNLV